MADISIEVNEINVVSVKRSAKGYLSLSVKAQEELRQLKTANVLLETDRIGAYDTERHHFPSIYNVYSNSKSSNYNILWMKASNYTKLRIKPSKYNYFKLNYM